MPKGHELRPEDCWSPGGRLQVEVDPQTNSVSLWGNPDGLVGLARLLLWTVQNGMQTGRFVDVAAFGAFEAGATTVRIGRDPKQPVPKR